MKDYSIKKALEFLVFEDETKALDTINMLARLEDKSEILDFVLPEDVSVWEKVELDFTVKEFLELIEE